MFHSPLGVPASFAAVSLAGRTEAAIDAALNFLIPRLRPCGLDRETGELITGATPMQDRVIDRAGLATLRDFAASADLGLSVRLRDMSVQVERPEGWIRGSR